MNSESNSKSRLKTTKGKFIVRFNELELLALNYGLRHPTLSVLGGLCLKRNSPKLNLAITVIN